MALNKKIKKYINTPKLNYLYNCVTGCTIMSKKELIEKILPIPTNCKYLIHDSWIGLIASLNGKISYIEEKYIKYRQHKENQVGTKKVTRGFSKLQQIRKLLIEVKLELFQIYTEYNKKFPEDLRKLNIEAYNYFKMIENKNNFNFRKWSVFHQLYKTENFVYYIENFLIMNMPFFAKGLFKIRNKILKLLKR